MSLLSCFRSGDKDDLKNGNKGKGSESESESDNQPPATSTSTTSNRGAARSVEDESNKAEHKITLAKKAFDDRLKELDNLFKNHHELLDAKVAAVEGPKGKGVVTGPEDEEEVKSEGKHAAAGSISSYPRKPKKCVPLFSRLLCLLAFSWVVYSVDRLVSSLFVVCSFVRSFVSFLPPLCLPGLLALGLVFNQSTGCINSGGLVFLSDLKFTSQSRRYSFPLDFEALTTSADFDSSRSKRTEDDSDDEEKLGDPICDRYGFEIFEQGVAVVSLADGCNWGPKPFEVRVTDSIGFLFWF
jgi:hypothetical protein